MVFEKNEIERVCYQTIYSCWESCNHSFPDFLIPVPEIKRQRNEVFMAKQLRNLQKQLRSYSNPLIPKRIWRKHFLSLIHTILFQEPVIGIHEAFSNSTLNDMQREFSRFFQSASSFDNVMGMSEIGQAARNYLVYDVFTEIHNLPHNMTPAIFGYSMLYPYTDNYIDNPDIPQEKKEKYNQMIADCIKEKSIFAKEPHFQKTCDLLNFVTHFYEKEERIDIQNGLLFMLDAQKKSLSQTHKSGQALLTKDEIFKISSYKGGISVLIDRFYVPKTLSPQDFVFYLSYGFFLQLADDLQDITEDRNTGRQTLFTYGSFEGYDMDAQKTHNEKILNQLFHYLHSIMAEYPMSNPELKSFIERNCHLLLLYSAFMTPENFHDAYLEQFVPFLPLSLAFILEQRKALNPFLQNPELKDIIADGLCRFDTQP